MQIFHHNSYAYRTLDLEVMCICVCLYNNILLIIVAGCTFDSDVINHHTLILNFIGIINLPCARSWPWFSESYMHGHPHPSSFEGYRCTTVCVSIYVTLMHAQMQYYTIHNMHSL